MYQVMFQYVRDVLLSHLNSKQKIKHFFTVMITAVACYQPSQFLKGDFEIFKLLLKESSRKNSMC